MDQRLKVVVNEVGHAFSGMVLDETMGRPGLPGLCILGRM